MQTTTTTTTFSQFNKQALGSGVQEKKLYVKSKKQCFFKILFCTQMPTIGPVEGYRLYYHKECKIKFLNHFAGLYLLILSQWLSFGLGRRKIRLIESNAKCHYLKKN